MRACTVNLIVCFLPEQVLLLRLRQACIHPYLAQTRVEEPTVPEDALPESIQATVGGCCCHVWRDSILQCCASIMFKLDRLHPSRVTFGDFNSQIFRLKRVTCIQKGTANFQVPPSWKGYAQGAPCDDKTACCLASWTLVYLKEKENSGVMVISSLVLPLNGAFYAHQPIWNPAAKPGEMMAKQKVELFRKLVALDAPECPICMDIAQDGVISECGHGPFCRECMDTLLHNSVHLPT